MIYFPPPSRRGNVEFETSKTPGRLPPSLSRRGIVIEISRFSRVINFSPPLVIAWAEGVFNFSDDDDDEDDCWLRATLPGEIMFLFSVSVRQAGVLSSLGGNCVFNILSAGGPVPEVLFVIISQLYFYFFFSFAYSQ